MADTDVNTEVVAQGESQIPQETQVQEPVENANKEERNWQKARELLETQKRELNLERERRLKYEQELARLSSQQRQPEPDELSKLSKDDIITVEQAEKIAERKFKKLFSETEDLKGEDRARKKFSDYDTVVNQENLERLRKEEPDIFDEVSKMPSLYGKATAAYAHLKRIVGDPEANENRDRLEKNLAKPRSVNSLGASGAINQAALYEKGLTPDLKKQLLSEMISASKKS